MRLAYIQNANIPTEWTNSYQIMKTCEAFARASVRVDLVLPKRKNPNRNRDPFAYYRMKPSFDVHWVGVIDLVPYVPFSWEKIPYLLERWMFLRGVKRRQELCEADVWYTRDLRIAQELLSFPDAKPVVVELHDEPRTSLSRWREIKERVAGYVVISRGLQALLLEEGISAEKILVAPDAFDAEAFSHLPTKEEARRALGIEPSVTLLVYTGQLMAWKGMDALVPVFGRLPDGVHLALVGGFKEDLERLTPLLPAGHEKRVTFVGQVPHERVLTWLAAADAGVLPTSAKFAIGKRFTSPLKLFEYMAAGLPVIASDVPSSREIVNGRNGLFFEPDSGPSFLEAVGGFLRLSPGEKRRLSETARADAQPFSWKKRGESIARFLQSIVGD